MTSTPAAERTRLSDEPDLSALLDDGLSLFEAEVRKIHDEDWGRPTPCDDWCIRDLVGHVVSTMTAGARILEGRSVPPTPTRPRDSVGTSRPEVVAAEVQELARSFRTSLADADLAEERDTPTGRRTMREGLGFPIVDLAVHTWDLSAALGSPVEIPPPLLAFAEEFARATPESVLRNPRLFAQPVEPRNGASPTEQLMAFLGREVPVPPEDGVEGEDLPPDPTAPTPMANPKPVWPDDQPAIPDEHWGRLGGEATGGASGWVADQLAAIDAAGTTDAVDVQGRPVVVVTVLGRRSGQPRRVPLMRVEHEGLYAAVASKGGAPDHPQWYHSIVAHPGVLLQDGTETVRRIARRIEGAERSTWWARCVMAFPPYADYEKKAGDREIPVFLLEPVAAEVEDEDPIDEPDTMDVAEVFSAGLMPRPDRPI